jgi:hypothetical protein
MVIPGIGWPDAGTDKAASANALTVTVRMIFTNWSPQEWGTRRVGAPPVQLLGRVAAVLGVMAFVLVGHVLAAVLAAIHALMLGRSTLLMLGMLRHRIGGSRYNGRLGGQNGRGNQSNHDSSPEFE